MRANPTIAATASTTDTIVPTSATITTPAVAMFMTVLATTIVTTRVEVVIVAANVIPTKIVWTHA